MKQFNIPTFYRSPLITYIKNKRKKEDKLKKDFSPTLLQFGSVQIFVARHFGFCYGVENAIEIAFNTAYENPDKNIYLLSEMIHNPQVNADLQALGIQFLQDTKGNTLIPFDALTANDIVLIPAFGTTLKTEAALRAKGLQIEAYNTTCPFVEKVWNRGEQIAGKGFSLIIHGKTNHEETRATFSHSSAKAPALVIEDMEEAKTLASYMLGQLTTDDFYTKFSDRISTGFNPETDLNKIGVINQTTMLATETQAIADFLRATVLERAKLFPATEISFADTRDTLCYATNDNQTAVRELLAVPDADLALIVGGFNSSNTSHLVELCEKQLPTYFINNADNLLNEKEIKHFDIHTKQIIETSDYLPKKATVKILLSSGASCPDAIVEQVIERIAAITGNETEFETYVKTLVVRYF